MVLETLGMGGGDDVFAEPRKLLEKIRDAGFDGIDLPDHKAKKLDTRELRKIAGDLGLATPAIVGAWGYWHAGEERDLASTTEATRKRGIAYARECIDLAEESGARVLEICAVPRECTYPICLEPVPVLRRNFVESTREICAYASEHGVDIVIEPINRYEGYSGFLNNFDDALSVIDEIDMPSLGVLADLFHMGFECVSVCESLRQAGQRLRHVHLADHNRLLPGCGNIDFCAVLRAMIDVGFDGYLSLDCVPVKPDLDTFLQSSLSYMKAMEKAVDLQRTLYRMYFP